LAHKYIFQKKSTHKMSAIASIKENKIVVASHLVFYGNEATAALAIACIDEIMQLYNEPAAQIMVNKTNYTVVFEITAQVLDTKDAQQKAHTNTDITNNFIRIEATKSAGIGLHSNRSEMYLNNNAGFFVTTDALGSSTTVAHEYGHSLGLVHPPPDQRNQGNPGIMAARGTLVDAEFRYGNWQQTQYLGIAPTLRRVQPYEIELIFENTSFDQNNVAHIGTASNFIYDASGRLMTQYVS
jgi:hypothetical protein